MEPIDQAPGGHEEVVGNISICGVLAELDKVALEFR
jgi:hypothetical protein